MTSRDFCFWLQGVFEIAKPQVLDAAQTELIKRHLALVFKHEIDPSAGSSAHQGELNEIHSPFKPSPTGPLGEMVFRC